MLKKIVVLVYAMLLGFVLHAATAVDSVLLKAHEEYVEGRFEEAANLYQSLADSGYVNAKLYYNLGNAYFKCNKVPNAILNYERAYLLDPTDEDIEFNLEYARTFTVDRFESIPTFFLKKWYYSVRSLCTSNGWAWMSIAVLVLLLTSGMVFWFSSTPWVKRTLFIAGSVFLILFVMSTLFSIQEKNRALAKDKAIVFQSVVTVKSSPGSSGKELFILHAGTKVNVLQNVGEWTEIRIEDGNKGWIQSETMEVI